MRNIRTKTTFFSLNLPKPEMWMKNYIFRTGIILLLPLLLVSCSKDMDDEASILGTWIEESPVAGRTTLVFLSGNKLIKTDTEGNLEEYNYKIEGEKLFISLSGNREGEAEISFKQINPNKIKLGNLYPSIPEADPVFIIFERK